MYNDQPAGLSRFTLPAGTMVFHGTNSPDLQDNDPLTSPAWVTTEHKVAEYFMRWQEWENPRHRVITYRTTRDLDLILIRGRTDFDLLEDQYGIATDSSEDMAAGVCRLDCDGWYIPDNYRPGDDIMLCDTSVLAYVSTQALPLREARDPRLDMRMLLGRLTQIL
jgi:hypothetical protein